MNFLDLFKKPVTVSLPEYPPIALEEIPNASALLFYGGTKLTEIAGNRIYHYPYHPPAFHAAFYIEDGLFLNVGAFQTVEVLADNFQSTRRVDVIIYKTIGGEARERLCNDAFLHVSRPRIGFVLPDYDWRGYLHFGLRFIKPGRHEFCSENVVRLFNREGVTISEKQPDDTAPWDLQTFAERHPLLCDMRTLQVGADYKG